MARKYFGTDGIRGSVGQHPITPDFVLRLAHAVGRVLCRTETSPKVVIGKDTRVSGYMLEYALTSGFNSAGVHVELFGPVPTPAVAYLTRGLRASLGVVISASHNPFPDNGIKFFSAQGTKLSDAWEEDVEAALEAPPEWVNASALGKAHRLDDAAGRYIEFCKNTFPTDLKLKGLKIVVDAAHGAAHRIAPQVFHELGAEVVAIGCDPNGFNINDKVGATHPEALIAAVRHHKADFGVALDGDADRLQMVDASGRLFNGDELLYLIALDRIKRNTDTGIPHIKGVVGTVMTNMAIEQALRGLGLDFARTKVGDRYILEELKKRDWWLGGEASGHLLVLDKHTTGDGLISALQVLQGCLRAQQTMAEQLSDVALFPQTLLNVPWTAGRNWQDHPPLQAAITQVEQVLGENGRVLVRASGTEPVLRFMVEARDANTAKEMAQRLASTIS